MKHTKKRPQTRKIKKKNNYDIIPVDYDGDDYMVWVW